MTISAAAGQPDTAPFCLGDDGKDWQAEMLGRQAVLPFGRKEPYQPGRAECMKSTCRPRFADGTWYFRTRSRCCPTRHFAIPYRLYSEYSGVGDR